MFFMPIGFQFVVAKFVQLFALFTYFIRIWRKALEKWLLLVDRIHAQALTHTHAVQNAVIVRIANMWYGRANAIQKQQTSDIKQSSFSLSWSRSVSLALSRSFFLILTFYLRDSVDGSVRPKFKWGLLCACCVRICFDIDALKIHGRCVVVHFVITHRNVQYTFFFQVNR